MGGGGVKKSPYLKDYSSVLMFINSSHFISSGVGLTSLSSPSIEGEEGRPREPDKTPSSPS